MLLVEIGTLWGFGENASMPSPSSFSSRQVEMSLLVLQLGGPTQKDGAASTFSCILVILSQIF